MGDTTNIRKHSFQHGARSIIQMGEELIGHPTSAINELVKNGYDADAIEINVYIDIKEDSKESFLIIKDNGTGMHESILFGEWLQPSVSSKRKKTHSEIFNRKFLGNKGIGRLAAMALGEKLNVISKTIDCENYNWISLNSSQFQEEILLDKIKSILPNNQVEIVGEIRMKNPIIEQIDILVDTLDILAILEQDILLQKQVENNYTENAANHNANIG